jgi:(E)-4-hydroxy-3-methylbut-2-enyl-diphosphate synthase
MWKDRLYFSDLEGQAAAALIGRINSLKAMGCGLLRFAVPDIESAEIIGNLASMVSMPLVADIHFDHKIALRCLDFPIAKLRINPGNIGGKDKVKALLSRAALRKVPIRIGVNAGSLPADLRAELETGRLDSALALVKTAERELPLFEEFGFRDYIVSMKASGIADTIRANRIFAARHDVPLHIGVTEAGPLVAGVARSSAALISLLSEGIGDTIRVSLSDSVENEVIAGREILSAVKEMAGEKPRGVRIVSCPLCGRSSFDTHAFTARWQSRLYALEKSINVAIMGCVVNGPGEARDAELGITGAGDKVLIFRQGKVVRTLSQAEADAAFEEELNRL